MIRNGIFTVSLFVLCSAVGCVKNGKRQVETAQSVSQAKNAGPQKTLPEDNSAWQPLKNVVADGRLLAPLPLPVTSFGAASIGKDLYVLGGYFGTPHRYSKEQQSSSLYKLAKGSKKWRAMQPMDEGAQGLALVEHDGVLYRIGGMVAENTAGTPSVLRSVPDVARFDPRRGVWEPLPDMPQGRSSHDAVVIGNKVFVVGGWELRGDRAPRWHDTMLIGTLRRNGSPEWEVATVPFARRGLALAKFGSRLAVIGGMTKDGEISDHVDLYNPRTRRWNRAPNFPAVGFGVAAIGRNAKLYASSSNGVVYRLVEGAPDWKVLGRLTSPRFFHRLLLSGDNLVALGGILGQEAEGRVRLTEKLSILKEDDPLRMQMLTFKNPGGAKNRQGLFYKNGTLYAFGGNNSLGQHDFEPDNFLNEGVRINLASLAWTKMAPMPVKRQTLKVAVNNDTALVVGGFGHDGESAKAQADIFEYNLRDDSWFQREKGLPTPRTQFGLVADGDKVWIFGGLNYDDSKPEGKHFQHKRDVLQASLSGGANFSDAKADMPIKMRAFASALMNNKIYVVGGMRANFKFVEDAMALDLKTKRWVAIPKPNHARLSGELVALKGKLFLVGGTIKKGEDTESDRSVEMYDPSKRRWRTVIEELPFDTRHVHALSAEGKLVLYSAHNDDDEITVVSLDVPGKS